MTTTTAQPPAPHSARNGLGQLRLVVAGSVDDGKSTLVGRLLHDTKNILADTYDSMVAASTSRGAEQVDLALLTDGLRAEREQGITIDVASGTSPRPGAPSSSPTPRGTCSTRATWSLAPPPLTQPSSSWTRDTGSATRRVVTPR